MSLVEHDTPNAKVSTHNDCKLANYQYVAI